MNRVIIHTGLHKCASSYLQEVVFPGLDARFLKLDRDPDGGGTMLDAIRFGDVFDAALYREKVIRLTGWRKDGDVPLIISHEGLSGPPDGSGPWSAMGVAQRLRDAFPEARLLVMVRNQADYMSSLYAYRVCVNGLETRNVQRYLNDHLNLQLAGKLRYDELVDGYRKLFSAERILVMPVEMLKHEEASFLDRFGRFAGIRIAQTTVAKDTRLVNASTRSLRSIQWCRATNAAASLALGALRAAGFSGAADRCRRHFMHAKSRRLLPWLNRRPGEVRIDLPAPVRASLLERFAGSNRRLSELTGIDFSIYGYVS